MINSEHLRTPFENLTCSHKSHGILEGFYGGVIEGVIRIKKECDHNKGRDIRRHYFQQSDRIKDMVERELANTNEDHGLESQIIRKSWKNESKAVIAMILSAHVDDLKGTSTRSLAMKLLAHLENIFDKCKSNFDNFEHIGINHSKSPRGVMCEQNAYIDNIKPVETALF